MKNVKLLDCTLRDGGYINDWEFGHDTMISLFERLVSSGVDIIEIGFLDDRRPFDINRCIMPDTSCVKKIFGDVNKHQAMVVAMIDYGTCAIENLQPCSETDLDGIRVIFKKGVMREALSYCAKIKVLGYKVFTNCVSITSYNSEELLELIGLINEIEPYAVSIVDTYGLLHQEGLMKIFNVMDAKLKPEIQLAYHAHNNFQLGYANGIEFMRQDTQRPLMVDGTLYGMGKSAGNAPLELLAMYMNEYYGKCYDNSSMLDAIENDLMDIYTKTMWGYKPFFFISASKKVHPNYVSFLIDKGTLSMKSVNELLERLEEDKKLMYDQKLIEQMYLEYQQNECDDKTDRMMLKEMLVGKNVLIIGPGRTVKERAEDIKSYIQTRTPVVIAINCLPVGIVPDYVFATNIKRFTKLISKLVKPDFTHVKLIATSNLSRVNRDFTFVLNYSSLIDAETDIPDNSLIMLLRALMDSGVDTVALAGFDGYTQGEGNYLDAEMEYSFIRDKVDYLNNYAKTFIADIADRLHVEFVTQSRYQE